jgi:S-adenosylmethionine decarboxylase
MLKRHAVHLILDCEGCSNLDNEDKIRDFLESFPAEIGMKTISKPEVIKYNHPKDEAENGITGFVVLAESHLAIHTYPARSYFALDIFTCKQFDVEKAIAIVKKEFNVENLKKQFIERGI